MKLFVLLALVAVASASFVDQLSPLDLSQPANNMELIEKINSRNDITWTAGPNWEDDMTLGDVVDMLGGFINPEDMEEEWDMPEGFQAPDAFSWTEAMPECVGGVRDQGRCGSCWAFAEVETLEDRFCIHSKGSNNPQLAPQDPVSCDKANLGCRGGRLSSWKYMAKSGVVKEECMPYTSGGGERGKCPKECPTGAPWEKFYSLKASSMNGEEKMKAAIATEGPIEVAFTVYEDFIAYKGGVYKHTTGKALGGHAVEAVGYGADENGNPYWLIKNSWSTKWGEKGFFRFFRGDNQCGLERQTVAGLPKL